MITVFLHSLSRYRNQILGWGLTLALLAAYVVSLYDTMAAQQEDYLKLFTAYPKELMSFFGDITTIFTVDGYLNFTVFSYLPPILGVFAAVAASGLLASDEEKGTLDLVLAHPVSRTALFAGRLFAFLVATVAILILSWLGFVLTVGPTRLTVTAGELALPHLSLFAVMVFFAGLGLLLSMVLPSRGAAAMTAALLLVANYFITSLGRVTENLREIETFTPLHYYQGGAAILGLNVEWFLGLLAVGVLFIVLAWWAFLRRDIRVSGEGSWRLGA